MPHLRLGEQRLDPHLPFAHRLLVGLGWMVATNRVEVGLGEGAVDHAAMVAGRAFCFDEAGVAGPGLGPEKRLCLGVLGLAPPQHLPLWTTVRVSAGVVRELALPEERRAAVEVRQREKGPDPRVLEGDDVFGRAVGRVSGDVVGPELTPETD